ncbi:MAG: hypothetical protein A2Y82_05580 [Candidatus Buchananbacteria bacterium RBG_13_36_9]|uniref:Uncharacterized protein n=1 Tax=Candidatus Buchananbacteria bacterium RBG_13_36_9 TaxID=1797530 RepID=A0A1G1XP67_9BACT|nr:MAG: hypothetical protein A2Y82_05580 [Candidatus Buchananbacteria bacterium RBG_13_36_9]
MGIFMVYAMMVSFTVFVGGLVIAVCLKKIPHPKLAVKPTVSTDDKSDKSLNWLIKKIRWADNRLNKNPKCKRDAKMNALAVIEKALYLRNETRRQKQVRQLAIDVLVKFTKANPMRLISSFGPREKANCLLGYIPIWENGEIIDQCEDSYRQVEAKIDDTLFADAA